MTSLLFGIHCHQPVDNFDYVVENAIEKSYKPFFQVLKNFPGFKVSVHYSGWLLEFIEKKDPELFALMQSLSSQLEFFTGGFYEPVLASIPSKDRVGQIKKLNKYIKKHFNQTPKGLWLTERVWDNAIIRDLKKCGIEYVIVDDYHFIASGYDKNNLNGYFITEEGGESIGLFPINKALRYAIPFYENEEVNRTLKGFSNDEGRNAAVIFDDGEKFGIWPRTYESVYEKEWLKEFFEITSKDEETRVETYREFFENNKPISLAYLPTASYQEMGEWALKADDCIMLEHMVENAHEGKEFLKGGIWKNFLTKYQESNWIHKRVLELSKKQIKDKAYKDALYKAQCNDVLWHGVFGGIYLPNLRDNAYKYIIDCEKILEEENQSIDIDLDGEKEYKFNTKDLLTVIAPKNGGQIFELDLKEESFNLQNTLSRYKEAYHHKIVVREEKSGEDEDGVKTIHDNLLEVDKEISKDYDWYLKKSAVDHISDGSLNIETFEKSSFNECGDFANQPFEVVKEGVKSVTLEREGGIYRDEKSVTKLEKSFLFENAGIKITNKITTQSDEEYRYLNEWNLHFANIKELEFNGKSLESSLMFKGKKLIIKDNFLKRAFSFSFSNEDDLDIYIVPLRTISQSEQGVDLSVQGITIGFITKLNKKLDLSYSLKVERL